MNHEKQALHALMSHLPPGPWHARGNKVLAGENVVAIAMCRQSSFVANQIARLPDLLTDAGNRVTELQARIEELESKLAEYETGDEDVDF